MPIKSYRDLEVWQESVRLAVSVVALTRSLPREELFGYTSQMRRAAGSIAANIAEGYGRHTRREYLRHLAIAFGSLCELETHLVVVHEVGWVDAPAFASVTAQCARVGRMLAGLRRALRPPVPDPQSPLPR